jgi:hypothetical protein
MAERQKMVVLLNSLMKKHHQTVGLVGDGG